MNNRLSVIIISVLIDKKILSWGYFEQKKPNNSEELLGFVHTLFISFQYIRRIHDMNTITS